ncbi:MAG: hypothetical protein ACRDD2_04040 [Sarcina sp.]
MKLNLNLRDVSIPCKRLRKDNLATGSLRRGDKVIPISVKGSDIDKYVRDNGYDKLVDVEISGENIKVKIALSKRDLIIHNIVNIDFIEVN